MTAVETYGDDLYEPDDAEIAWLYGENGRPQPEPDSWTPRNLSLLPDEPPVQPTLGGLGIVYPGKRHVFSGPQESAKTLAAYVIGLTVIRAGQKLVLIDFEMGPWDTRTRLRELGATEAEVAEIAYVEPSSPASKPAIDALVALEPGLVIVDAGAGAFQLQELDDNKRGDVERLNALYVTPFWKAGIASIVVDHVTKSTEHRGAYAIGSERKVGATDVHLGFSVVKPISRGETGIYKVTTHKDRGGCLKRGHLCDFKLVSDPETHAISWEIVTAPAVDSEHPFRPTVKMEQVSRWLEKHSEPVPMSHVEEGVGGNRDACRLAIQILIDEGHVNETSGPRKARLLELIQVYRESSDDLSPTSPDLSQIGAPSDLSSSPNPLQGGEVEGEVERGEERWSQPDLSLAAIGHTSNPLLDEFTETCRQCGRGFNRGSGNRGDLCKQCVAEELG